MNKKNTMNFCHRLAGKRNMEKGKTCGKKYLHMKGLSAEDIMI